MAGDDAVLVEDFLEAIASQLDRAQDGLAFKAVNRPLTYAIKDFNLQLQAFVEVDVEGNVRIRSSGPNESGASTMTIAFTTITRPMIQENTISLAAAKGPTLKEAGFSPAEEKRLERLGVRNTAQLRRLGSSTGASVMSRLSQVPVDRLRAALQVERPAVTSVRPVARNGHGPGVNVAADVEPARGPSLAEKARSAPLVRLGPGASHLQLVGTSLAADETVPRISIDGVPLEVTENDWDRIVVALPPEVTSGVLEVELPGGDVSQYELVREVADDDGFHASPPPANGSADLIEPSDLWLAEES
jgi:hypothetical protein